MSELIVKKLKKYVLYISTVFFVWIGIHLVYWYLYEWATSEPMQWWTVSEAIIGNFPHFNPLVPSNDHNAYINGLLYRSMLQYSTQTENFESDLVSCNLDNLLYIECVIENNLTWSNGEEITTGDIKATLDIISETKVNPNLAALLKDSLIETTSDSISFKNTNKDINFLEIFLQPILPQSVIERLDTQNIDGKFSEIWGIYSGRFVLTNISQDKTVGITKLTLWRNSHYFGNDMYINFLILNLFRDEAHFLKNKNSFNIFNDSDSIIGNSIPRLNNFEYTLSQFGAAFLNTQTLSKDLRWFLSHRINREEIVSTLWFQKVIPAYNPFLTDIIIDSDSGNFSIEEYLNTQGYYSKKELLKTVLAVRKQLEEKQISGETTAQEIPKIEKNQDTLNYVTSPSNRKYNFVSQDNILIQWVVDDWVDAVFINNYKLSGFTPWDTVFYYRLLEAYDSIKPGENSYTVYFEKNRELEEKETFFYIYETDTEKLNTLQTSYFDISQEVTPENWTWSILTWSTLEWVTTEINTEVDTALTAKQVEALSDKYFYNSLWNPFEINIVFTQTSSEMQLTAEKIREQFEGAGISSNIIELSLWDITSGLRNDSLTYDILLIGIDLKYFKSNVYQHFHSDEIKNWYNFSNFELFGLDILLEELKSNNLSTTKREELEAKILSILRQEHTLKVLYTPKTQLLVDKNIKNFSLPVHLPDVKHRYFPLLDAYLSEKKIISTEEKSFVWFFSYLLKQFFI